MPPTSTSRSYLIILIIVFIAASALSVHLFLKRNNVVPTNVEQASSTIVATSTFIKMTTWEKENERRSMEMWKVVDGVVQYENVKQSHLDASTFKVIDSIYVSDKNGVYFSTGYYGIIDRVIGADPETFVVIDYGYGKDKNSIYFFGKNITEADRATFTVLPTLLHDYSEYSDRGWYAKDLRNVYYRDSIVAGANPESINYIGGGYAKDENYVYYGGVLLAGADPATISTVSEYYAKDNRYVYASGKALDVPIDPYSFRVVGSNLIADKNKVYNMMNFNHIDNKYEFVALENIDASTFQEIATCRCVEKSCGYYHKDKNNIFVNFVATSSIDVESFLFFGSYGYLGEVPVSLGYAKDKNNVYVGCGSILEQADPSTFIDLKNGFTKDSKHVWSMGYQLNMADVKSFISLGGGYARDKNNIYFHDNVVPNADISTFTIVSGKNKYDYESFYGKDKNYVYEFGNIVIDVAPEKCKPETIDDCHGAHN